MARGGDDLEGLRPYLELAREIRAEVERIAAGGPEAAGALDAALDAVPRREREAMARAVFARLSPDHQWAVLERVFGDDEIRAHLAEARRSRLDEVARRGAHVELAHAARAAGRIDVAELPAGLTLTVGLFLPPDVGAAVARGRASSVCARELVVRTTGSGDVHVLADVFNPRRGLFVTPDYDEAVWSRERLDSHARVRIGSAGAGGDPAAFEPVLHPAGRVDVEAGGTLRPGRLHLGFALVGEEDVFATAS